MAKVKGITLKKNKVEQTFDLSDLFGASLKGRRDVKEAIGQAIIDKIITRTESGKAIGGKTKLKKPYSKSYQKSLDFKAAGKSKNSINMSLTGDMLGLLDIKKQSGDSITIGWKDKVENNKAFNHNTGDTVPRREFFGLNKKEMGDIKREFKSEVEDVLDKPKTEDSLFLLSIIDKIAGSK